MLLNQAYRKHHKHWYDYNQHNTTDGEYLAYFDTSIVPSRGRVKNPSIIPKRPTSAPTRLKPKPSGPSQDDDPYQRKLPQQDSKKSEGSLKLAKSVKKFKATEESIPEDLLKK